MAEDSSFVVVGLGEVLWDVLPEGKQLGGAPANFTFHVNTLGAHGKIVSCLGYDALGREAREFLQVHNLTVDSIADDPAHPTGTVSVALDDTGQPTYTIHENVAWDFLPFNASHARLASQADAVCFGTLASRNSHSRESIRRFLDATMPRCLRVFDVNLRQQFYEREIIRDWMERADVLKLNEDELPVVAALLNISGSTKERMERLIDEYALQAVALTRGARGSVFITPETMEVHHGIRVGGLADTVGAGDAFTAVLVMGLLQEWPADKISKCANELAAFVCSQPGAMASHPEDLVSVY